MIFAAIACLFILTVASALARLLFID